MRKKDIRQDMPPAASSDPAASAPATDVAKPAELKSETPKVALSQTEAPNAEIPKVETGQIDLPKLEAAIVDAPRVEPPKAEAAKVELPKFDSARHDQAKVDPPKTDALKFDPLKTAAAFQAKQATATAQAEAARPRPNRFPLLAASVALAAAFGAVLGSLAMAGISKFTAATPAAATQATTAATTTFAPATATAPAPAAAPTRSVTVADPQLKEAMARVRTDIAALKAELEASNRAISAHFSKIGDRIDRAERAQADPAAKITRIIETLDRIEVRTAAAAAAAPAPTPAPTPVAAPAAPAAPDTTGSIASDGRPKPPVVDGWVLRQVFDGFALIEGFNGRLFEVGPGSNIPGIGRVEAIRRVEGQWVVLTPKGVITR